MQFEHLIVEDVSYICSRAGVIVRKEMSSFGEPVNYHNNGCSGSVVGVCRFRELSDKIHRDDLPWSVGDLIWLERSVTNFSHPSFEITQVQSNGNIATICDVWNSNTLDTMSHSTCD